MDGWDGMDGLINSSCSDSLLLTNVENNRDEAWGSFSVGFHIQLMVKKATVVPGHRQRVSQHSHTMAARKEHNMVWPEGNSFKNTDFVCGSREESQREAGWLSGGRHAATRWFRGLWRMWIKKVANWMWGMTLYELMSTQYAELIKACFSCDDFNWKQSFVCARKLHFKFGTQN